MQDKGFAINCVSPRRLGNSSLSVFYSIVYTRMHIITYIHTHANTWNRKIHMHKHTFTHWIAPHTHFYSYLSAIHTFTQNTYTILHIIDIDMLCITIHTYHIITHFYSYLSIIHTFTQNPYTILHNIDLDMLCITIEVCMVALSKMNLHWIHCIPFLPPQAVHDEVGIHRTSKKTRHSFRTQP